MIFFGNFIKFNQKFQLYSEKTNKFNEGKNVKT